MEFKLIGKYLSGPAFALSASLNGMLGLSALMFTVLTVSLPPDAKVLIYSKEGQAFLAASWVERGLLHNLIDPPRGEAAQRRLLVRVLDELQTRAGQEFAAAGLNLAQRPEF